MHPRFIHYEGTVHVLDTNTNEEITLSKWQSLYGTNYRFVTVSNQQNHIPGQTIELEDAERNTDENKNSRESKNIEQRLDTLESHLKSLLNRLSETNLLSETNYESRTSSRKKKCKKRKRQEKKYDRNMKVGDLETDPTGLGFLAEEASGVSSEIQVPIKNGGRCVLLSKHLLNFRNMSTT